jgi:hypothetical protein
MEGSYLIELPFHRREHQDGSSDIRSTDLANKLKAIPSSRMGAALGPDVELHEDRIELRCFST